MLTAMCNNLVTSDHIVGLGIFSYDNKPRDNLSHTLTKELYI